MSLFTMISFNNMLTSKFFQFSCYIEFCQQSHVFLIYFILGMHEAYSVTVFNQFQIVEKRVNITSFLISKISSFSSHLFSPKNLSRCGVGHTGKQVSRNKSNCNEGHQSYKLFPTSTFRYWENFTDQGPLQTVTYPLVLLSVSKPP